MGQPILQEQTQTELRKQNSENFNVIINGRAMREPRRLIYIHTVAQKGRFAPPRSLFKKTFFRGCENGEPWVTCAVIGDPIPLSSPDQERGGQRIDEHDGWRACIDWLNSSNTTTDPYDGSGNPDFFANRQGLNLIAEGYFPSLNEIPTDKEVGRAREAVRKHYKWLTDNAIRLSGSGMQREFNEFLQTYPEVHVGMDQLGLTAPWHAASVIEAHCPNCGETIRPGIAFHYDVEKTLCIIDPVRTLKAGKITREQYEMIVPEDKAPEPKRRG